MIQKGRKFGNLSKLKKNMSKTLFSYSFLNILQFEVNLREQGVVALLQKYVIYYHLQNWPRVYGGNRGFCENIYICIYAKECTCLYIWTLDKLQILFAEVFKQALFCFLASFNERNSEECRQSQCRSCRLKSRQGDHPKDILHEPSCFKN